MDTLHVNYKINYAPGFVLLPSWGSDDLNHASGSNSGATGLQAQLAGTLRNSCTREFDRNKAFASFQ